MLSLCAYGGTWYAVSLREATMHAELGRQEEELAQRENGSALALVFEDTVVERAKLQDYVVSRDDATTFLELVEGAGRAQGLAVNTTSVTIEALPQTDIFEALVVALTVTGSYKDVKTMLALLETMPLQVKVRSVSLSREGGDSWRGAFVIDVTKRK